VQPAGLTSYVQTSDARLSDAREWSAPTVDQPTAEAGISATRVAYNPLRVFQSVAAWWAASEFKTKLDGIAAGATVNASDAQLRDRSTHTGTQAVGTITGLGTLATQSGTFSGTSSGTNTGDQDLSGKANTGAIGSSGLTMTAGVLGRDTGTGAPAVLTLGSGLSISGGALVATASGGGSASQEYAVGKFFNPFEGPLGSGMANNANVVSLMPFTVKRSGIVSEIGLRNVAGVGGVVCRVAIYPSLNGEPTDVPLGATASMSNGANANVVDTLATQFNLMADTVYWVGVNVSAGSTVTFTTITTANTYPWNIVGVASIGGSANILGPFNYSIAQAFGTWPNLTGATLTLNHATNRAPAIWIKYSAFL
jgi:hypothetical protein